MAILGMLGVEPMSGYDMMRFYERSLAHFWHESYGNLYPRLKRLAGAGLIRGRRESRARAPDATVYSLTAPGRAAFGEWLEASPEPERVRSELLLKIFFGAQAGLALAERRLREHERRQLQLLDDYEKIARLIEAGPGDGADAPYWRMALRRGQLLTEARLLWCRESLAMIETTTARDTAS